MTISERMFEIMDEKHISAYTICQKTGLKNSTISNWRSRNTDPPAKYLVPICEILHCSLEYLLTGSDKNIGIYSRADAVRAGFAPNPSRDPKNYSIGGRIDFMLGTHLESHANLLSAISISPDSPEADAFYRGEIDARHIIPICKFLGCSVNFLLTGEKEKKAPAIEISENGCEMLELYELLPERDQLLLLGRLQEMTAPLLSSKERPGGHSTEEAV